MAEEEKAVVLPEEPKKKSPIILIAVLVVVGLILAGGISYFVTSKVMTDSANAGGEPMYHDPGVFIKLGDAKEGMIVNVGDIKSGRFLKVGITVEFNPGKSDNIADGKLLPQSETKVMDVVLQTLRSVKLDELDATKQDALKTKIKDELNSTLGPGSVYDVYITSFLLQ